MFKIVFVDDEFLIIDGLKKIIDWEKYNIEIVGTAQNAADGLELIKNKKPDIVITDVKMRGPDGLELISEAIKCGYDGYTIILSGYQDFEYARRAIENKVFRYLLKPIDIEELENTISRIVDLMSKKETRRNEKKNAFLSAVQYIDRHFDEDIRLSDLAETYHFESGYFSKKFKEKVGVTYSDYVTNRRIESAKKYLEETDMSVAEISETVGYMDVRYFREVFKRITGTTPRGYKRIKGKGESNE